MTTAQATTAARTSAPGIVHGTNRLRSIDVAAIQALGVAGVRVRKPSVRIARVGGGRDDIADAVADWVAYAIAAGGGEPVASGPGADVEALLTGGGVDAVTLLGGTGFGPRDDAVHALARIGTGWLAWNASR